MLNASEVLVKSIIVVLACSFFFLGCHIFYTLPYSSMPLEVVKQTMLIWFSCRLTTAVFLFPNSISVYVTLILCIGLGYDYTILHVHWVRLVSKFLCIISHLAPPPCLLRVCPYMGILCNSFDKGCHSVLYSSCTLLPAFGRCAPDAYIIIVFIVPTYKPKHLVNSLQLQYFCVQA